MTVIHNIVSFSKSGLTGVQSCQRDWSPYLVHFTSWSAMKPIRAAIKNAKPPKEIAIMLRDADAKSLAVAQKIASSGILKANSPNPTQNMPPCVCFSECTLPGLIAHAERFGRFGFVFTKRDAYTLGARPCIYVDSAIYAIFDKTYSASTIPEEQRIFGLANVYCPSGAGRVQDFTLEREWRLFDPMSFVPYLKAILCPSQHFDAMNNYFPNTPIFPLDMLHEWGA